MNEPSDRDPKRQVTGYNHDIPYAGRIYHVQTEFFDADPARIETHVYGEGRILASERLELGDGAAEDGDLRRLLKQQQKAMIKRLIGGRLPQVSSDPPEGVHRQLRSETETIDLRRSILDLARAVGDERPRDSEIGVRLHSAGRAADELIRRHEYRGSRRDELAELVVVREEARVILSRGSNTSVGLALWESLRTAVLNMSRINGRHDLRAYDQRVWTEALDTLRTREVAPSRTLIDRLLTTEGRDADLDALVRSPTVPLRADLIGLLEQALERLQSDPPRAGGDRDADDDLGSAPPRAGD